ncbi:uncharacterized protein LOC143276554 isoform X2 [Babylonia areolata]|uniref:uncharacterized protein LOC143276554 isoform X2 n=1 Tax=Babylonia areolata TaxID=304850 RepID=UPI003FD1C4B5
MCDETVGACLVFLLTGEKSFVCVCVRERERERESRRDLWALACTAFGEDIFPIVSAGVLIRVSRGRGVPPPSRHSRPSPYSSRYPQFPPYPNRHTTPRRRHSTPPGPCTLRPAASRPHPYSSHPRRACLQSSSPTGSRQTQFPVPSVHNEFRNLLSDYHHHPDYPHSHHLPQLDYLSVRWVTEWDEVLSPSPSFLLQLGLPLPEAVSSGAASSSSSGASEDSGVSSAEEGEGGHGEVHHAEPRAQKRQQPGEASRFGGDGVPGGTLGRPPSSFRRLPVFSRLTQTGVEDTQGKGPGISLADAFLDVLQLEAASGDEGIDNSIRTTSEPLPVACGVSR